MPKPNLKRACKFTEQLSREFNFIKKTKLESMVVCEKCRSEFSISSGGRADITRHLSSDKHKKHVESEASSSSITTFFRSSTFGDKEKQLAAAEALFSYHVIKHNQSFRSMDCTSGLIQKLFEKKFTCKRTKTEAIIKKVLAPYVYNNLTEELKSVNYVSIYSDASNHGDVKLFPTLVRYFNEFTGTQIKILEFVNLPGETSQVIFNSLREIIKRENLCDKLVAYCADNANTNFGGAARKGVENVFSKLNNEYPQKLIGVGCAAHIIHNTIQTASDLLPLDIESVISKIYQYFYIYTVRTEQLKSFCDEADTEYKKLLGYSKTRWLALLPAIERVLKLFAPLKSFFLSIDKCPRILDNFFNDSTSELWLLFLHNQASLFSNTVKNIEGNKKTVIEVAEAINDLKMKCKERLDSEFLPLVLKKLLNSLVDDGSINVSWFIAQIKCFYQNCIDYLNKWSNNFDIAKNFDCIMLKKLISWDDFQKCLEKLNNNFPGNHTSENELFDEISCLRRFVTSDVLEKWAKNNVDTDERWLDVFSHFRNNSMPYRNVKALVEFCLCLPGTNAPTERVFSLINKIWTTEKTQLNVETVKAMITVSHNIDLSCDKFYDCILRNEDILKKVHSSEKYL